MRWRPNWRGKRVPGQRLRKSSSNTTAAVISADERTIAAVDGNRIQFWDARTGGFRGSVRNEEDVAFRRVTFAPQPQDATRVLTTIDDHGKLRSWIGSDMPRQTVLYVGGVVRDLACFAEPPELVGVGDAQRVDWIDLRNTSRRQSIICTRPVQRVAVATNERVGKRFTVAVFRDGSASVYERKRDSEEVIQRPESFDHIADLRVSSDGERMLMLMDDQSLRVRHLVTGANEPIQRVDGERYVDLCTSPAGPPHVLAATTNGQIVRWNFANDEWTQVSRFDTNLSIQQLTTMSDGHLVTRSDGGHVAVWDVEQQAAIAELTQSGAFALTAHPKKPRLAFAVGSEIHVWQIKDGKLRRVGSPLSDHRGLVVSLAFTTDGRRLVSSSEDRSVMVWRVK